MDLDKKLISCVRTFTFLYDKSNVKYKNGQAQENAWMTIASILQLNVDEVKRKWKLLRNKFSDVRKRKSRAPAGSEPVHWSLYESMMFLDKHVAFRNTYSSIAMSKTDRLRELPVSYPSEEYVESVVKEEPADHENQEYSCSELDCQSQSKYLKRDYELTETKCNLDYNRFNRTELKFEEDPEFMFGRSMALLLKDIKSLKTRRVVQANICNLISEAIESDPE